MTYSPVFSVFTTILGCLSCLFLFSTPLIAEETGWLEFEAGFTEAKLGVQLREIQILKDESGQRILLAVPKSKVAKPEDMEEVIVIGYPQGGLDKDQVIEARIEWLQALDAEHYGLYLDIGNEFIFPIRLFFKADNTLDIDP